MARQIAAKMKAGQADEFGVIGLNGFMGGGHAWCLSEAPNSDAVCKAHEAMGMKIGPGDVTEIQSFV